MATIILRSINAALTARQAKGLISRSSTVLVESSKNYQKGAALCQQRFHSASNNTRIISINGTWTFLRNWSTASTESERSDNFSLSWKRPPGPPKVWKRIESATESRIKTKDEKPLKFTVEEVPVERVEDAVDLMANYFIPDEVICNSLKIKDDPLAVQDCRDLWRLALRQGISVAVFLEDSSVELREIAAVNVIFVMTPEDEKKLKNYKLKSKRTKPVLEYVFSVTDKINVMKHYGVDKFMAGFGMTVNPRFRGHSLGGYLLGSRNEIGREYNLRATETSFTGPASQTLALRSGFEILWQKKYSELYDENGKPLFPDVKIEYCTMMGKRLD
ncbi:uncharacterized protein LOC107273866 isoform X2 [Cephus cinctus]|uniref:Uncharacterized protein LOC107273866 isoform X2 n=1 Tax=Cephus cinctus TaxID=211228 RepID=A0AAJ7CDM7_CEPCN|nr:uncharacterized protein LOC107273866 isoform X2 [Cephus cinctus]